MPVSNTGLSDAPAPGCVPQETGCVEGVPPEPVPPLPLAGASPVIRLSLLVMWVAAEVLAAIAVIRAFAITSLIFSVRVAMSPN